MEPQLTDVTMLLKHVASGNQDAAAKVIPLVYEELHRVAENRLRLERPDHTLQPTALVHDAYLKLVAQRDANWQSRTFLRGCFSADAENPGGLRTGPAASQARQEAIQAPIGKDICDLQRQMRRAVGIG